MDMKPEAFIPGTMNRQITPEIVYRPIRSWHSLTYAGEGLRSVGGDGSGCVHENDMCRKPLSVTHRLYWRVADPTDTISAFLSYPGGMGYWEKKYFWEIYYPRCIEDVERFLEEEEMERRVVQLLTRSAR